ncbi:alcohol dehydrogenase [Penicillium cosmopolitanum]|uniref:Alcohol dehydrogenase n=1 Tax=Penicillium cosmopolitanum TaxID=1131564 RepID=A0A9X0BDP6_9EURO|nr:alcohol dehydrogenase [Penicillium cosmopolitanum]KAJ5408943.1 alcohol dehydrogenase [Penicillium cosmopolitanum]
MPSFINEAAWIASAKSKPLQVGPAPAPIPEENEIVIKVAYAAINPVDWKLQEDASFELKYPFILGTDVAGTIVQLGSGVTRFKLGQRVIGHCDGFVSGKASNCAFQLYTTCREILVAAVPDSLPLANAVVLPISISTASSALFVQLKAPLPSLNSQFTGKKILIWGGSSSVGSSAIQLAHASGLEVIATASSANHALVKQLGATDVFDHKDTDTVDKISNLLRPGDLVVDCISSEDTQVKCGEILSRIGGGKLPILGFPKGIAPRKCGTSIWMKHLLILRSERSRAWIHESQVGDAVWRQYIPSALANGKFQAKPDPVIVKGGLSKVQEGIDFLRGGVSAKKVVVEIAQE